MRAHTITTISRRRRNAQLRRALALGLGICALAIPASASAYSITGDPSSVNSTTGDSSKSGQSSIVLRRNGSEAEPFVGAGSSIVLRRNGSEAEPFVADLAPRYSSARAIGGVPAPTLVAGSPPSSDDGFDWGSAVVGAGAAMALAALGAAALLAARRRVPVPPPAPTG